MFRYLICQVGGYRDGYNKTHGFTLIETMITIVIIGLLSAIAIPSLMGQVTKAHETEAKIALDFLKKIQYTFYLENNSFTEDLKQLNFSPRRSENYRYFVEALENYSSLNGRLHVAFSRKKGMRSYGSVIYLKDGQLEDCGLLVDDISDEHSDVEKLWFVWNAIQHYEQYCS